MTTTNKKATTIADTYAGAKGALANAYNKQSKAMLKGYYVVSSHIYSWLGPSNYIAYAYCLDVLDYLDDLGLLQQRVKYFANKMDDIYNKYQTIALERTEKGGKKNDTKLSTKPAKEGDIKSLWSNLCVRVYSRVSEHIEMLYWTVNSFLKKLGTEGNVDLYSRIFVAHMLFDLATQRYEAFFKVLGDKYANGHNFSTDFPEFNYRAIRDWWIKIEDILIPQNINPEFCKDEFCQRAFDIVVAKLNDTVILNDSATEALECDPVFAEQSKEIRDNWQQEQERIINAL